MVFCSAATSVWPHHKAIEFELCDKVTQICSRPYTLQRMKCVIDGDNLVPTTKFPSPLSSQYVTDRLSW